MLYSSASRRLKVLHRILLQPRSTGSSFSNYVGLGVLRLSSDATKITLGNISQKIKVPKNFPYVPYLYFKNGAPQSLLKHLRWMMQKDLLGQDVFLIGPPGPIRRNLALSYLELVQKEVEFITLTRDTTDSDLKQRREIKAGTSFYHDQSAVRAAIEGRVLILEGVEKAERNVLPVLNNLLENREMQLEDGRLLISAKRYDKLLENHSEEELHSMKLVRVSEDFRVIALGLPSPPYQGHPLDPPLRSRFQAREVSNIPFKEHLEELLESFPELSSDVITRTLSMSHTLSSEESKGLGLPDFPVDHLRRVFEIMKAFPSSKIESVLQRVYPASVFLSKEGQKSAQNAFSSFSLEPPKRESKSDSILEVIPSATTEPTAGLETLINGQKSFAKVPSGTSFNEISPGWSSYVRTAYHDTFVCDLLTSHAVGDFCVVGPRGCGKSAAVSHLAELLGYQVEPILLYQDMTSRDLVQQRVTNNEGDTSWQFSPLIVAALEGKMALLDGLHRLHHGTLAVLHRLLHDREIQLYDSTRLLRHDRYDAIKEKTGMTDAELASSGVRRIHPSFRVVGLAEPPKVGSPKGQWLTAESLSLFLYHPMRPLDHKETSELVTRKIGSSVPLVEDLISLVSRFSASGDPALQSLSQSLSLRQIIRMAKRFQSYPQFDLHTAVYKACLARFLPSLSRKALDDALLDAGISKPNTQVDSKEWKCQVSDGVLTIGTTSSPVHSPEDVTKVPDTLFFDIQQHLHVLENMLQDWLLGDHLLLIGNQGVGKNKLADRFLYLLSRPREYIQLHRDTTVQSLTLQPSVKEGRIEFEDSPLVLAVKSGNVLVVDEADKAPTHVTCVLKTLVEMGEMLLSDGRRIVPKSHPLALRNSPNIIVSHPDFRMIVLANRPGFPFLGNDFFGTLGDLFSCHAIDNPSVESEMSLLKQYGPDVPESTMRQLVGAFSELRDLADQGLIQYPYSTREVVSIVKHLQNYGDDGVATVVQNVFDFDIWAGEAKQTVMRVMHKYGIPVGASPSNVNLAKRFPLPEPVIASSWRIGQQRQKAKAQLMQLPIETSTLRFKGPMKIQVSRDLLEPSETRSTVFSEQESFWALPFYETSLASAVTSSIDAKNNPGIHVVTTSPFALYSVYPRTGPSPLQYYLLHEVVPVRRGSSSPPRINVASLPLEHMAIHEETTNTLIILHPPSTQLWTVQLESLFESAAASFKMNFNTIKNDDEPFFRMNRTLSDEGMLVMWEFGGSRLRLLDIFSKTVFSTSVPLQLASVNPLSKNEILVEDESGTKYLLRQKPDSSLSVVHPIKENTIPEMQAITISPTNAFTPISDFVLSAALKQKISAPSTLLSPTKDYASIAVGFPELDTSDNEIYLWKRDHSVSFDSPRLNDPANTTTLLPDAGQVVRILEKLPENVRKDLNVAGNASYLEVTDLSNKGIFYLPIPRPSTSPMWNFLARGKASSVMLTKVGGDSVATVDSSGGVRMWETGSTKLEKALEDWKRMVGDGDKPVRLEVERASGKDVSSPKHGKVDPTGNPHVGGSTWAGGTGGRDTAGLGGKGGPYRLDAGHDVHQIPQSEKDAVPEEVKRAAREMGQKAFKERLKEIQMSEYDASLYEKLKGNVNPHIKALRNIVSSLQAKSKERQWLRHRTDGELDDLKLIEGIAGERNVYRQRREEEPEIGAPQVKPKRLRLVVDISGSMYRFNGHDGRLERELEATLMVMEAFEGFENKFKYDIYGHSGEEPAELLVRADKVPANNKERLDVLKTMQAHSQFCLSGDYTLEAARLATTSLAKEDADESFVVLLSDANLDRYGIRPHQLNAALNADPSINSYAVFIGSLGNQADQLKRALPAGRSFVCLDLSQLPQILQQIFTSAMLT